MKKVIIVDVGEFGIVPRAIYNETSRLMRDYLEWQGLSFGGIKVEIYDRELMYLKAQSYDVIIYISRINLEKARGIKKNLPEKKVVILSGLVERGDKKFGIIPMEG